MVNTLDLHLTKGGHSINYLPFLGYTSKNATYWLYQIQIKDEIKAARIEATKAYNTYVEELKTNQRRYRLDLELELFIFNRRS